MLIEIFPDNPDLRKVREVADVLRKGGLIISPTDTVYCLACDMNNKRAIEKLAKLKGIKLNKANFSIACNSLSALSEFTKQVDRPIYKILNKALPGPFTFILNASNRIPKLFDSNKKTIGIRIPDNNILQAIIRELGNPLVVTSVHDDDEILDYTTDPSDIHERYEKEVRYVIDGGYGHNIASTIVDCTTNEPEIIRQGIGEL